MHRCTLTPYTWLLCHLLHRLDVSAWQLRKLQTACPAQATLQPLQCSKPRTDLAVTASNGTAAACGTRGHLLDQRLLPDRGGQQSIPSLQCGGCGGAHGSCPSLAGKLLAQARPLQQAQQGLCEGAVHACGCAERM